MRTLSARLTLGVIYACLFFALAAVGIGVTGIIGVQSATSAGNEISRDELATSSATAALGQDIDAAFASGQALLLSANPQTRSRLATQLYDEQIPAVESRLAALQRLHEGDDADELADVSLLVEQWTAVRAVLTQQSAGSPETSNENLAATLTSASAPLTKHLNALIARENIDGRTDQQQATDVGSRTTWVIIATIGFAIAVALGLGWLGSRRLRRAVEPAEEQVEFADTLQLAENEDEAHQLLQRHLQRTVADSVVTVLNRNNSADRLEAVTELVPGSPLVATLAHAEPRSCLTIRSGRTHDEDDQRVSLLGCPVCASCPGRSTCTPLTVGGEVIGSVLVNRHARYSPLERQQIRDSVSQAAPVLANLRNLAIAELRAATDSLTGLPNKRAVDDTLKRMLAQASRTLSPLTLVLLDLDHFKEINDRFGHPAGDQTLANVGAALRSALRESDFAGRTGGEEFAVILPDTDTEGAVRTAEKIRASIAEITLPGLDLRITGSVGIAAYPEHATGSERLERLADSALYVAKRSGRDRIEIASPGAEPSAAGVPRAEALASTANGAAL